MHSFIKVEPGKVSDPRNITAMSPEMHATIGPYFAKVEELLSAQPNNAKGLTISALEDLLTERFAHKAMFDECDESRMDGNTMSEVIRVVEGGVYECWFPKHMHPLFWYYFERLSPFQSYHMAGFKFKSNSRPSGGSNTGCGNFLVNLLHACLVHHFKPFDDLMAGDDRVGATNQPYADIVQRVRRADHIMGLDTKQAYKPDYFTFLGRVWYHSGPSLRSIADPRRTIARLCIFVNVQPNAGVAYKQGRCLAKALSYNCTDARTPVVGAYTSAVITVLGNVRPRHDRDTMYRQEMGGAVRLWANPDPEAYIAMAVHSGLSVPVLRHVEAELRFASSFNVLPTAIPVLECWDQGTPDPVGPGFGVSDGGYIVLAGGAGLPRGGF